MTKRIAVWLCVLLLLPGLALGDIQWPTLQDAAYDALKVYIDRVNQNQLQQNANPVNSLFECYPTFAALGVTAQDMAEVPEGVELTIALENGVLDTLQLRVSDVSCFAALAASCIQAASPDISLEAARSIPSEQAQSVTKAPENSFEDPVELLNGASLRVYYAYYPNQYKDGISWLQMTLVFPLPGSENAGLSATPPPDDAHLQSDGEYSADYDGYDYDGGTHLEIFSTATPEPDSPAGEHQS